MSKEKDVTLEISFALVTPENVETRIKEIEETHYEKIKKVYPLIEFAPNGMWFGISKEKQIEAVKKLNKECLIFFMMVKEDKK